MSPKSGSPGSVVTPADPAKPHEADKADPVSTAEAKARQRQKQRGKYGSEKVEPYKPPEDPEDKKNKTAWIEIELVGEDNSPIAGEAYRIILPDGAVASGTLDENGRARVEGIEPGSCKITFPDLDEEAWAKA